MNALCYRACWRAARCRGCSRFPKLVIAPFLAADVARVRHRAPAALAGARRALLLGAALGSVFRRSRRSPGRRSARADRGDSRGTTRPAPRGAIKAQRAPFRLAATGAPEIAFLWKNLLVDARLLPAADAADRGRRHRGRLHAGSARHPSMVGHLAGRVGISRLTAAIFTLLLGPQIARNDLRSDLLNADILKTYPLRGWQIVLGEMLTPIAILTSSLWLELLALTSVGSARGCFREFGMPTCAARCRDGLASARTALLRAAAPRAERRWPCSFPRGCRRCRTAASTVSMSWASGSSSSPGSPWSQPSRCCLRPSARWWCSS